MGIFAGSRYEGTNLVALVEDSRTRVLMEFRTPLTVDDIGEDPFRHTVQESDNIDDLAFRFGGKHRLWWIIAEINDLTFPFELTINQVLLIPQPSFFGKF